MDSMSYLICFYTVKPLLCAFWTVTNLFYNLLNWGCKLYLLLVRKDYKRIVNMSIIEFIDNINNAIFYLQCLFLSLCYLQIVFCKWLFKSCLLAFWLCVCTCTVCVLEGTLKYTDKTLMPEPSKDVSLPHTTHTPELPWDVSQPTVTDGMNLCSFVLAHPQNVIINQIHSLTCVLRVCLSMCQPHFLLLGDRKSDFELNARTVKMHLTYFLDLYYFFYTVFYFWDFQIVLK